MMDTNGYRQNAGELDDEGRDRTHRLRNMVVTLANHVDALTIQRDAAEALARARGLAIVADDEALRALLKQSIADTDAAQQMVAEMRLHIDTMKRKAEDGWMWTDHACAECVDDAPAHLNGWKCVRHRTDAIIEATAPIAGRWCLASERDEALAILLAFIAAEDECGKSLGSGRGMGMYSDAMDRARKLVGGGE